MISHRFKKPKRKTAGQMSLKAKADNSIYDPLEVGHALTDEVCNQLRICAETHAKIFDEDEFFIALVVASDPLIQLVRRHKYAAFLYMPKPRPQQSVFLYNKKTGDCFRLWSLPDAKTMAVISVLSSVSNKWKATKYWADSFFNGTFFQNIRAQYKISHLSEREYLDLHRPELIKASGDQLESSSPDPFDYSKITVKQIVDKYESFLD